MPPSPGADRRTSSLFHGVLLLCLLLCGLVAGQNCTGSGTGSEGARTISRDLRVCIDLGNEASAAASAAGTIAGVLAAALDVRAHNCRAVAGCGSLLPEDVDLSVKYVYSGGTALGAAKAAVSCSDSGGRVYVTYPDSQTRVLVPYNSAKGVLTAAFQPVFSQDSLDIEPFLSTYPNPDDGAQALVRFASYFGWEKLTLIHQEGDTRYVDEVKRAAFGSSLEARAFNIGRTASVIDQMKAVKDFGTTIIVLCSVMDSSFNHNPHAYASVSLALEEGERLGLLEPQYTWIGVHLATTVYVNHKNRMGGSKDDLLAKLEAEMIYLETTDEVVSDSALMFGNSILDQSDLMDKIKPAVGEFHLSDSVDWKEFTTAYDSAWLIAAAFSHHLATSEILQSSSSAAGDDKEPCDPCHVANEDAAEQLGVLQWLSAIPSVSFTGLSGAVSVKSNNSTSFELADHDANDFFVKTLSAAGGKQVINRLPAITPIFSPAYRGNRVFWLVLNDASVLRLSIKPALRRTFRPPAKHPIRAVLPASGAGLELLPGDNTIPWRDGTSYPGNIPNSHYSRPAGDESSASQAMIGQIAAAGVGSLLCVMLMLVAAGYIRLNKTLNSIASSEVIDLQSPITKAVAILKEISATRLTSLHQRKRAMEAALALLQAENVHAPDWKSQVNNQNKDILSFLTFDAKVGGNKPALDAGSHRTWSMFKRILRQDTSATGSSREPSLVPIHDSRISFSVPDRNLLRDAGKDVFFDVLAFAKLSSCKPLLSISIHVLRNFNLARILHLNEEVFAAFVAAIEEGYNDLPYHNAIHAADVLARVCSIMYGDRIFDASNSREAHLLLSVIIAAIVHDFNHPGLTNKYQVETDSEMSREFNEQMVLENVSLRRSLMMMRQEEFDFAPEMSHKAKQLLSSNVINLVLSTDISRHFELVSAFKTKIVPRIKVGAEDTPVVSKSPSFSLNRTPRSTTFKSKLPILALSSTGNSQDELREIAPGPDAQASSLLSQSMTGLNLSQKIAVLQMALKVADLGHMAAPFNAHHEWSRRLEDEFFAQGDKERELGMSITPLMDRQKPGVMEPTNQITFANVVVIPMLEAWAEVAGEGSRSLLQQARDNQQQWQRVAHSEAARSLSGMNQEV